MLQCQRILKKQEIKRDLSHQDTKQVIKHNSKIKRRIKKEGVQGFRKQIFENLKKSPA